MRKLPHGWEWRRLTDLVTFPQGQVSPLYPPYSSYLLVAPDHIESKTGRLLEKKTAKDQGAISGKYLVEPGDVLYSKIRPALRKATQVDFHGLCSADMYPLRAKRDVDPRFLLAVLLSETFSRFAESRSGRSGIPKVNRKELDEFFLPLPGIDEQRRISHILDVLDGCILETERIIGKLKLRQAGIEAHLVEQIDEASRPLAEYLAVSPRNGFSPKEVDDWTGVVALGLACLTESGFESRQIKNVPARDPRNNAALLNEGDLLISRANTRSLVGLAGRYRDVGVPCIYPDLMMRLTPNGRCSAEFMEIVLRGASIRRQIQAIAQGTSESMVKISGSGVSRLEVSIPDLSAQRRIVEIVEEFAGRVRNEVEVREKLLLLRRGLLDDLLIGPTGALERV